MQEYITTDQLADLLKVKKNTVERWRSSRDCPILWTKINRRVLYALSDVNAYLESQKRDRVHITDDQSATLPKPQHPAAKYINESA